MTPPPRDAPQPRRDVAVTAEGPRFLPDRDERVLDGVGDDVTIVAPAREPQHLPGD